MDDYNWQDEAMEEMIDLLQYQQKRIMQLQRDNKTAESYGEMYRLKYIQVVEGE